MDETNRVEKQRVEEFRELIATAPDVFSFTFWLDSMRRLQEIAYGAYYDDFDPETRADSIRMNFMACVKELSEMTDEMGWKPWATPQGWVNREAVIMEAVDAMHFLANLLSHAKCTGAELTAVYKKKMLKNLDRQLEGYDAVSDKCGFCKRDLSELGITQGYETAHEGKIIKFCDHTHFTLWSQANKEKILNG